jgi:hypothetical protein
MLLTAAYTHQSSSQTSVIILLMRLGRWVIMKMHPDEKSLHTVSELTPALRELVARMARSAAKDAVQDVMERKGMVFTGDRYISRGEAVAALDTVRDAYITLMTKGSTPDERQEAMDSITRARDLLQYQVLTAFRLAGDDE